MTTTWLTHRSGIAHRHAMWLPWRNYDPIAFCGAIGSVDKVRCLPRQRRCRACLRIGDARLRKTAKPAR